LYHRDEEKGVMMPTLWAQVESMNPSTYDTDSITVLNESKERTTLRVNKDPHFQLMNLYFFELEPIEFKEKPGFQVLKSTHVDEMPISVTEKFNVLKNFYPATSESIEELIVYTEKALHSIENKNIKALTEAILNPLKDKFFLYPAATKFHHAYIGGIAHHTVSMLKLMEGFLKNYPFLNRDLLTSGIILHDLFKVEELTDYKDPSYSRDGKLLGHISLGAQAIYKASYELELGESEERVLLEHMVLTHHYYGHFGSPKKPNLAEALALHFIDNIDAKFVVLGEALSQTEEGTFTQSLNIIDKERFYKPKI
jgi:3'-5' exoribonuclease